MLGLGAMRLSTVPERDEAAAAAVLRAALTAGIQLIDTADVYALSDADLGHNERLVQTVLETWDAAPPHVATKGGLTRPKGRWVPNGKAKHLRAAAEASVVALGRVPDLYQLHTVDPRTSFKTSVRALSRVLRDGHAKAVGLCNVRRSQLIEALDLAPIASVQVAVSPYDDAALRSGVIELALEKGLRVLAHSPFGGPKKARRIARDPVLNELAAELGCSAHGVVLGALVAVGIVPLPGPTRVESARELGSVPTLDEAHLERIDAVFPGLGWLRGRMAGREGPSLDDAVDRDEVVLLMGGPGSGKTTRALDMVAQGYGRLNRDREGGTLKDLLGPLDRGLAEGERRWVLDNTYPDRASRNRVIELAWRHGVPVRCVHVDTPFDEALVNAAVRQVRHYGRLLALDKASKLVNAEATGPGAAFRFRRRLERPERDEGFAQLERIPFERTWDAGEAAVLVELDGLVRRSASGAPRVTGPEDVELLPGAAEWLRERAQSGLVIGLAWHPAVEEAGQDANAITRATLDALGVEFPVYVCPHRAGPPRCWCMRPLPGLGALAIVNHGLDPRRCTVHGATRADRTFAERLGMAFVQGLGTSWSPSGTAS